MVLKSDWIKNVGVIHTFTHETPMVGSVCLFDPTSDDVPDVFLVREDVEGVYACNLNRRSRLDVRAVNWDKPDVKVKSVKKQGAYSTGDLIVAFFLPLLTLTHDGGMYWNPTRGPVDIYVKRSLELQVKITPYGVVKIRKTHTPRNRSKQHD